MTNYQTSRAEERALAEVRRTLYSWMMNKGKIQVSLEAKQVLWLRLKAAAKALAES